MSNLNILNSKQRVDLGAYFVVLSVTEMNEPVEVLVLS